MKMLRNLTGKNSLLLLIGLTLLLLCPARNILAQGVVAASVLEIGGGWYVEGGGNISKGSSLRSGAIIRSRSPESQSDYIVITDPRGEIIDRRYCRNSGTCNNPIRIQEPAPCNWLCRVISTWGSDPNKYKTTGSQDIGKGLQEAVVSLNNKKLSLKSAFKEMPNGKYRIRFVDPPCKDLSDCKILFNPVDFEWSSKNSSLLPVANFRPGLYEVQLLKTDEDKPTGTGEAWILVSTEEKFPDLSAKFEEAVNLTQKWQADSQSSNGGDNDEIKNSTIRGFLRATLLSLSAQAKPNSAKKKVAAANKTLKSRKRKRSY